MNMSSELLEVIRMLLMMAGAILAVLDSVVVGSILYLLC